MIWESGYWKDPLLDLVKKIESWESRKDLDEPDLVDIERQIMMGFYSVRKLLEAKKLSDQVALISISAKSFPNLKNVNLLNWHHIDTLYDLNNPKEVQLHLLFAANQLIHSYVFIIDEKEEGGFSGIFFCSDNKRNEELFHVSSKELRRIFKLVGNDYPSDSSIRFNPKTKDYDLNQA